MRARLSTSLSAVAAVLVVGCGVQDDGVPRAELSPTPTLEVAAVDARASIPVDEAASAPDAYPAGSIINVVQLRGRTFTEVADDVEQRVAACMRAAGLAYQPVPFDVSDRGEDVTQPWGVVKQRRASVGYGITMRTRDLQDPNRSHLDAVTPDEQTSFLAALGDSGASGCRGAAEAAVYRDLPFYDPELAWVPARFVGEIEADERWIAAIGEWSNCMAARGFDVGTPEDARALITSE